MCRLLGSYTPVSLSLSVCLLASCWSLFECMPRRRWTFDSDSLAPTFLIVAAKAHAGPPYASVFRDRIYMVE